MATASVGSASPKLEKAYLEVREPSTPGAGAMAGAAQSLLGGATGGAGAGGGGSLGQLVFRFNPKEYTVAKTASWKRSDQRGAEQASVPEFTGSGPKTLSLEVFLDVAESPGGDIAADVDLLFSCCAPTDKSRDSERPSPPFVVFGWGSTTSFPAFVKKVQARYTMFRPDGCPTRAVCDLDLEEVPSPAARQNPTSGGTARRTHTVVAGETLASIAYREYRDASAWRAIAARNDLDDPLRLPPGTRLLLPPAAEAAPTATA